MKKVLLAAFLLSLPFLAAAQEENTEGEEVPHGFIKEQIEQHGGFRIVSITETKGDLAIFGDNDFVETGCPKKLVEELERLRRKGLRIIDVQHTEKGSWIVIYGENDYSSSLLGHPSLYRTMRAKLLELKQKKVPIRNFSFSESGYWAIVTERSTGEEDADYSIESIGELQGFLGQQGEHGNVLAVRFSENGGIAVYETGSVHFGDVPEELLDMVSDDNAKVTAVSFSGGSWFLSFGEEEFSYDL